MKMSPSIKKKNTILRIRGVEIKNPLLLAPMAEYTHDPFRSLVADFGCCGLFFSEMINAQRLLAENSLNTLIVKRNFRQRPFFYQIMGHTQEYLQDSIEFLDQAVDEKGYGPDGFDINMGCSIYWVQKSGAGVALQNDLNKMIQIIRACRKVTEKPLTAKLRLGRKNISEFLDICCILEAEGIDALTIHPRFADQRLRGIPRWDCITQAKRRLSIPVFGNGDVNATHIIDERLQETGCDGIMIGRYAIQKPWIFRKYSLKQDISVDITAIALEHFRRLRHHFVDSRAIIRFKQFMKFYQNNYLFGHDLFWKIHNSETAEEIIDFFKDAS